MRKIVLLVIAAFMLSSISWAQLTGVKTIPGSYATIEAAITALNAQGVGAGGVTFNVAANHVETFTTPTAGYITTNTGTSANQIIFQKSGVGNNPKITAGVGTGTLDAIICFNGVKYITFDGIDVAENVLNTTATTEMEWGYALLKVSGTQGSQNITIKNCTITLLQTYTATYGIYSNNHTTAATTQLTVTDVAGQNSNNKFYGNTITSCYNGIYLYGRADASPYTYYDQNNDIGSVTGNTFTNFAGGSSTAYVIYVAYQNNLTVAKSSINGGTATGALYGIYGATATNANANIYNNTITLTSAGTTGYIYGIYNSGIGTSGTTNTLNIYDNTVQNCTYPTATSAYFYGIYNSATAFTINFYGNTVNNNVIGGSGYTYLAYTSSVSGGTCNVYNNTVTNNQRTGNAATCYIYGLYVVGSGNTSIHDNTISGNAVTAITGYAAYIYSLYCSNSATSQMVYNNTVFNQSVTTSYTSASAVYGIYSYPASTGVNTNALYNNNVHDLTITNSSSGYGYIYGIYGYYMGNIYSNNLYNITVSSATGYGYGYGYYVAGAGIFNVYKNKLYNVSMAGTSGYYYGMYVSSPTTAYIHNNFISDLKTPASTSTSGLHGIYVGSGTTVNLYYNTIYLNCTNSSTTTFYSDAIYIATGTASELRNNIAINLSTAPGSTTYIAAAYRRSSTTLTSYTATSNNNDFYAGTPSANNLIFYDGTNSIQTMADFKTFVTPRDVSSFTEMPPFVNVATTPYDLHLQTTVPTQCESGGSVVSTPAITFDYDNHARYPNAGYPDNPLSPASAPDIGADEFAGLLLDISPPVISYTPFLNTSSLSARTLTTTITDQTGVPTTLPGMPRLYWRINTGTWNSVPASWVSGSTYTFTFGGGAALNDVISYYIVAQDVVAPPNIGANPAAGAAGFTANPPACSTPPTTPNSYTIVGTICGNKTIGTGGDYATLTEAATALNNSEMTCPVVWTILSTYSSAGETFPIIVDANPGSSAVNTLTIKPNTGVTAAISGDSPSGPVIAILNSFTIIDGSNTPSGTTQDLTITNTSATSPQVVFIGSNGTTPITDVILKNTIIVNGVNTSTAVVVRDAAGGAGYFNNITIQNNSIRKAYYAIFCVAATAPGNGSGTLITGNLMNSTGADALLGNGVYAQGVDGITVSDNIIGNITQGSYTFLPTGIWFATDTKNGVISGNVISNLAYTGTSSYSARGIVVSTGILNANINILNNKITGLSTSGSTQPYGIYVFSTMSGVRVENNEVGSILNSNTGGYGARGIYIATGLASSAVSLINNVVYDVKCTGDASQAYWGIGIGTDGATGNVNIYNNSVYLSGSYAGYTTGTISTALYLGSPATNIDVRNNMLMNTYDNTASSTDKSYAIYNASANTAFVPINYNDYYVSGTPGVLGYQGADVTTLAAWKIATGQDVNSLNNDPLFTSTTNLLPTTTLMNNAGVYLPQVLQDIVGVNRSNPPDMGAYEYAPDPVVVTLAASALTANTATLNGTVMANGLTMNTWFDYGPTNAYGTSLAGVPATVSGSTTTPISLAIASLLPNTTYHFRARAVHASITAYGSDLTFTTPALPPTVVTTAATGVNTTAATLNGTVNANDASTAVTFEYGPTTLYGSFAAGVPPTVTGTSVTPCSAAISGLQPNTLYHYRIVGTNSGGTSNGNDMTFTTAAAPPIVVTNPASGIGTTSATLNGSVTALNASTTVTFQYGLTLAYELPAVPGVPSPVTGNVATAVSANLTGLLTNTTYHFRCVGVNAGGTTYGADQTFLSGCPPVGPAGPITGSTSVCTNSTGIVYTVAPITNAVGYVWGVPTGAVITAGANTNSITVTFGANSGNVSVYGTGPCGDGTPSSLAVVVNPLPVPTIMGPASACQGTNTNVYNTETGMTGYVWTVSAGGAITAGAGTNAITVQWNSTGAQTVTVNYINGNGCTAPTPTSYAVTVNAAPVPTITGPTSMCVNSGYFDYYTQGGMTDYVWTVSSGGTITFGQGTSQIQVTWNTAGAQTVTVNYANANGCYALTPASLAVTVDPLPGTAGNITGTSTVCGGALGIAYSIAPVANAVSYVWNLPAGVTIATGFNTNSITVDFADNASSGNITAQGNNLCGNGTPSAPFAVTVTPKPATPLVTSMDITLNSSAPTGNQWYFSPTETGTGTPISGATGQVYIATETGWYWTVVTIGGCSSNPSNREYILVTGQQELQGGNFNIFPSPNDGRFTVSMSSTSLEKFNITIYNNLGQNIFELRDVEVNGNVQQTIDLRKAGNGIYTVVFQSNNHQVTKKVLINK